MQQFFKRIEVRRAAVVERSSANGRRNDGFLQVSGKKQLRTARNKLLLMITIDLRVCARNSAELLFLLLFCKLAKKEDSGAVGISAGVSQGAF